MFKSKLSRLQSLCTQAKNSFYVTTPIFYVNAAPHIGHLYSAVIADAICRYQRLKQPAVPLHFCTGTDEHGTKIQQAAASRAIPVDHYCTDISARYRQVFQDAHIGHTDFIRTTEERHKDAVTHFWNLLNSRGHIYSAQYSGWYCVSDETFLTDSQLRLDNSTGERFSLESGHPVEWTEETNYMFRLSALQDDIIYWIKQDGQRVRPLKFEKILLDMLNEPLPDVSVSRPASRVHWGIPVPQDQSQTVYVWLDALINYLTSAGYPNESYSNYWPPNVQVIGKDILKFHGVYWPAFLMAAGLEPPQQLFVHSHWTVDGQKMSKSKHNVVDPVQAAQTYTMEGLRYFLLREGVAHSDGNYSNVKALRILNAELADTLGNLLSRGCAKSLNPRQIYPRLHVEHLNEILRTDAAGRLQEALQQLEERCSQHYDDNNFYMVVDTVMSTLHAANNFFESARPWELKSASNKNKNSQQQPSSSSSSSSNSNGNSIGSADHNERTKKLETIIAMAMDTLRLCGIVLQPIVPQLSGKLLDKLNIPQEQRLWCNLSESFVNATKAAATNTPTTVSHVERPLATNVDAVLFRRILPKEDGPAAAAGDKAKIRLSPTANAAKQRSSNENDEKKQRQKGAKSKKMLQ